MATEHAITGGIAWEQLPLVLQQTILVLTGNPCARRVSKAWRGAFDAANDTLCFSFGSGKSLDVAATAAALRVVKNSASLTAVSLMEQWNYAPPHLMLSDLLAAGASSGLATRLQKLTGCISRVARASQQLQALRQCTSLTHLDVSASDLQDCLAVELTAALQAMPKLARLHISCDLQSQRVVAALASALQSLTQLQHLHLAGSRLGEAGLAALAPALSAMPGLQTLDVGGNSVSGAAGAEALCTLLGVVPGLTHLDVSYNRLRDEGTALLAAVLRGMTCLQTLNASYSSIDDKGMALLAPALAALPNLHTLNLSGNQLGPRSATSLQPVLAREGNPLHELDLSDNCLQSSGAQSLASGRSTVTQLRGFSFECTGLGPEGWVALAPSLSHLGPSLQLLELGRDSLNDAGTAALAAALQALTGITCLKATRCFGSAAMAAISPALTGMRRLQVLDLSGNAMRAEGTAAFAAALPALAGSLQHLDLSKCSIDAEAAANALAPALAQATGLAKLRLGCNDFGPQGAQWLVPVLRGLPHLREVVLCSCKLGVQGCMAVARALKDRDGMHVNLHGNGVSRDSAEGDELRKICL